MALENMKCYYSHYVDVAWLFVEASFSPLQGKRLCTIMAVCKAMEATFLFYRFVFRNLPIPLMNLKSK